MHVNAVTLTAGRAVTHKCRRPPALQLRSEKYGAEVSFGQTGPIAASRFGILLSGPQRRDAAQSPTWVTQLCRLTAAGDLYLHRNTSPGVQTAERRPAGGNVGRYRGAKPTMAHETHAICTQSFSSAEAACMHESMWAIIANLLLSFWENRLVTAKNHERWSQEEEAEASKCPKLYSAFRSASRLVRVTVCLGCFCR